MCKGNKLEKQLRHISFQDKVFFCLTASVQSLAAKYKKDNFLSGNSTFVLDSFFDYVLRCGEGVIVPLSQEEKSKIFSEACQKVYNSQNKYVPKEHLESFMILFSLWQFEEQEDIFIKFFRFNYLLNYKTEEFDAKEIFKQKFNTTYDRFAEFALTIYVVSTAGREINIKQYMQFIRQLFELYKDVVQNLCIDYSNYLELSYNYCPGEEYIPQSLKPSFSYPFISYNGSIYLPLPHLLPVACSKSLLYRLTDGDDLLRNKFGKEAFESYVLYIQEESGVYDKVVTEQVYKKGTNELKTPDVLCFSGDSLVAIECKLLTPSTKIRVLDNEAVIRLQNVLVDDLCKLYKSLFVNYQNNYKDLPKVDEANRIGYLVSLERIDFSHRFILEEVAKKLKLDEERTKFLNEHIFFGCIYDLERFTFAGGNLINEFKYMVSKNKIYDFSISMTTCSSKFTSKSFIEYKNKLLKLKYLKENYKNANSYK